MQDEGQRPAAHMPLGPYIGRSPESWEDQRMDQLDSPVEGYLAVDSAEPLPMRD